MRPGTTTEAGRAGDTLAARYFLAFVLVTLTIAPAGRRGGRLARYQIVFRNKIGDHTMLVDDPNRQEEALTYLHQSLVVGAIVKTNGNSWVVVSDLETADGLRRITCDPAQ